MKTITYSLTDNIGTLVLNRPEKHNAFNIESTKTLAVNTSYELFSVPVILENSTILKAQLAGTVSDGVSIGISYLNIKKDVVS